MQAETHAQHTDEIASRLSTVLSETTAVRLGTRDLQRKLKGPGCLTLRLLLGQQHDELRHAETELEARVQEVGGPTHGATQEIAMPAFAFATSDVGIRAVDEWVVSLVEAHEATVRAVLEAQRCAERAHDFRTSNLLARRTDVHEAAVCVLGSLYLASRVSCEFCSARSTCPLSVAPAARTGGSGEAESE